LKKPSTVSNEIKNTVPTDHIWKRQKVEQRITNYPGKWESAVIKKSETLIAPSAKVKGGRAIVQQETAQQEYDAEYLEKLYKKHQLEVKADKEPANDVNFEILFQDALPAEAIDLREYLRKYKEKDQTKEFNVEENNRLKKEIFDKITHPDNRIDRISMWAMADDSVKPKNKDILYPVN